MIRKPEGKTLSEIARRLLVFASEIDPDELFPVLIPDAAHLVTNDPYAFALAVCLDRGTRADIVWTIPYEIEQDLGHLDPYRINEMSLGELALLFKRLPQKPRYVNAAPRTVQELTWLVVSSYDGDASRIWKDHRATDVKRSFSSIHGVGEQISNMALLLIEKAFGQTFDDEDRQVMDIKADVHTMRVLYRLGASDEQTETAAVAAARRLNPSFPGGLDAPLWIIGRRWCHSYSPACHQCPMDSVCPKFESD